MRLLFQYMKALSKSNKLKTFIAPEMADLITFIYNNIKLSICSWGNIHELYCYLYIIGSPTTLTTSGQISHHFCPSYSTNNNTETLQPVIAALFVQQNTIFECCGIIGHKVDACTIRGPNFLPPRDMNQFNALSGGKTTDPPRECNSQPTAVHFKFHTPLPKPVLRFCL